MATYTKISEIAGSSLTALINAAIPSGLILPFGNTTAPTGFLSCDGSAVSRTTYSDLFTAIGTTWGSGDSSTTFNVPDLRGAFLRGTGSHGSETMADTNAFAGPSVGSFEDDQMQGHWHNFQYESDAETGAAENIATSGGAGTSGTIVTDAVTDTTNGTPRTGDETRPFNAGVLYCIKT